MNKINCEYSSQKNFDADLLWEILKFGAAYLDKLYVHSESKSDYEGFKSEYF